MPFILLINAATATKIPEIIMPIRTKLKCENRINHQLMANTIINTFTSTPAQYSIAMPLLEALNTQTASHFR